MNYLVSLLGLNGIIVVIGLGFFLYCYRYSTVIFEWI